MKDLNSARQEIDVIDKQLIDLFEKRMRAVGDVVAYKKEYGLAIFQLEREKQVIDKTMGYLSNDALKPYAKKFIIDLMNTSKNYQRFIVGEYDAIGIQDDLFEDYACDQMVVYHNAIDVLNALRDHLIDYGIVFFDDYYKGMCLVNEYGFDVKEMKRLECKKYIFVVGNR